MVSVDLNKGMAHTLSVLTKHPVKTRVNLTGTLIVARDSAHAKLKERLDRGEGLPDYFKQFPVYYAGPAKTPAGMPSGSFGPTTAGRMDSYVDLFQANGGSMVMLAKGNRSKQVVDACKKHKGFYLGSIGGPAAILAKNCIRKVEVLEYPELGMEAIWRIQVENFPAFIVTDDKGNDFFSDLKTLRQRRPRQVALPGLAAVPRRSIQFPEDRSPLPETSSLAAAAILARAPLVDPDIAVARVDHLQPVVAAAQHAELHVVAFDGRERAAQHAGPVVDGDRAVDPGIDRQQVGRDPAIGLCGRRRRCSRVPWRA